ncbi:hypothetical protein RND71_003412 [Anisodus tanguticus]|uniref:Putative plant transposon protein domain-containing protein n=1 Tax=Anisodus tanguticus TaxID=243964 RepID=A0AAE1SWL4_9SOLA|nr:hypothetical protein RND71_003412 [Anisodus tanguticus]
MHAHLRVHMWVRGEMVPDENDQDIAIEKAILLDCIISGCHINVGEIIVAEIGHKEDQGQTLFPFPCLVTGLCLDVKIPMLARVDSTIKADGEIDIFKRKDGMNLTTNRKKKETSHVLLNDTEHQFVSQTDIEPVIPAPTQTPSKAKFYKIITLISHQETFVVLYYDHRSRSLD